MSIASDKWPPHQYDSTKTVFYSRFNEICINVVAKPNSKLNEITDIKVNYACINVNAPPVDGEANKELIKYISNVLKTDSTYVKVEKGLISRSKVLVLSKQCKFNIEEVRQTLQKESKSYNHSQLRITSFFKN